MLEVDVCWDDAAVFSETTKVDGDLKQNVAKKQPRVFLRMYLSQNLV